jgi:hypothetical protein
MGASRIGRGWPVPIGGRWTAVFLLIEALVIEETSQLMAAKKEAALPRRPVAPGLRAGRGAKAVAR